MGIPQAVRELSERHGGVNKAARAIGMPEASLQALHTGRRGNPTLQTLRMLAAGLGVSLDELARRYELDHPDESEG